MCQRDQLPFSWFSLYAILGDDVIIGSSKVSAEYCVVMGELGVEIGLAKSLISPNRLVGEFAKRFFIPKDASMIPIKEVIAARFNLQEAVQMVQKYHMGMSQVLSFMGYGYRVKGSLNKRFCELGNRVCNLALTLQHPSSYLGVPFLT